ncbi:methyltransferase domain-containing protein [Shewanella sp. JM162201]|uniref:Methyltransferase domain-containing protein n=1 Tax=Shewanella jiangmenensis TaxID=2837387 RepID=A0ABS5UYI8_9GAMM|nr:class I SAM-dependent methyltransferase [Shewanella jiangmenensis]MBT1443174.1 methyltransferase domain-containing protein [Shewanella jiangmenensis]
MSWSSYWQQGHITSFGESLQKTYTGEIREYWMKALADISVGSHILDLASGNGALAILIQELTNDKSLSIIGVDKAQVITPDVEGVRLQSGIELCSLPFESESFDFVCSQFGFEYSEWNKSGPDCLRVLKVGGVMNLFMHSTDSFVVKRNHDIEALLSDAIVTEIFVLCRNLVELMGDVSSPADIATIKASSECERLRLSILENLDKLNRKLPAAFIDSEIGRCVQYLFTTALCWNVSRKCQYIEDSKRILKQQLSRLEDLSSAALTESQVDEIISLMDSQGAVLVSKHKVRVHSTGEAIGWGVCFRKKRR